MKPQQAQYLSVTEEHYWVLFYMTLYKFYTICAPTDCK
jgi:hypothetical protein